MVSLGFDRERANGPAPFSALLRLWKRLQVSYYGGKYSVERLLALEAYEKTHSFSRVLFVCIGTPVPMIVLVVLQEIIPLQDPAFGWRGNYSFWIRVAILAFVVAQTVTGQARYLIDGVTISERHLALLSSCASAIFTVCAMVISANLTFPVPFFVLTMAPMFYVVLIVSFRVIVGRHIWHEMLAHRDQLIRYIEFVCAQVTLAFVYPSYETLFHVVEGTRYQLAVIFLLPVIKVGVKNMMLRCTAHMEDMVPEAVIFTVDFFNAIYLATCMQSASSVTAVTAISVTDLLQTSMMVYGLHRRTVTIRPKLNQVIHSTLVSNNIVNTASLLCRNLEKFKNQIQADIRVHSCTSLLADRGDINLLKVLENMSKETQLSTKSPAEPDFTSSIYLKPRDLWAGPQTNTIYPILPSPNVAITMDRTFEMARSRQNVLATNPSLRETLEALFTIECIIVTAYLEAVVPLFYSSYILMMVHLQSAQYHTEMAGVTRDNVGGTVFPVFTFALLQLLSFVLLAFVIKQNCGIRALYQLAFVLETQLSLIQGKMMLWMMITICFRVVHFGMDFTFQFEWISSKTKAR